MEEITLEITNYCPHGCKFCSSRAVDDKSKATFLPVETVRAFLMGKRFEHIVLSGGEPLAHPQFYEIFQLCSEHTGDVVVYTNTIKHLIYNAQVIDGVYLEAHVTVTPETDKIHVLRRVKQGKEANRPEVHLSRNHFEDCQCDHQILRPDGSITKRPCNKWESVET